MSRAFTGLVNGNSWRKQKAIDLFISKAAKGQPIFLCSFLISITAIGLEVDQNDLIRKSG